MAEGRRRLGVVLLLDPPVSDQVDGLRRAVGDPSLARVAAHITLVPPVNVRAVDLPLALSVLRSGAGSVSGPIDLTLGAPASFVPANPVLYLPVGGDLARLATLRDKLLVPPLERPISWPWVPHVTLADGIADERISAALRSLSSYSELARMDRVVILEETPGRRWRPWADAALGPPARIGTGGLSIEFFAGRVLDPEVAQWPQVRQWPDRGGDHQDWFERVVVTARREDAAVGTAVAWLDRAGAHVAVVVAAGHRGQGIGSHLLARVETEVRHLGWTVPELLAEGPAGFFAARSRWSVGYSKATEA